MDFHPMLALSATKLKRLQPFGPSDKLKRPLLRPAKRLEESWQIIWAQIVVDIALIQDGNPQLYNSYI